MEFRLVENVPPKRWNEFVCAHGGHLLQSAEWGELKANFGWSVLRMALEREGELQAGAQVLFRRLPLGRRLAYVPRGPVVDRSASAALPDLYRALVAAARAQRAFVLKIEPDWFDSGPAAGLPGQPAAGLQPRTSVHVDLTRDPGKILAEMKPKWRYNIRLAERKGVVVRAGKTEDVPLFHRLLAITGERDRFEIHSLEYYARAFDLLQDHAALLVAEYQGEPLAAIFVTAFGAEAIYLYGASNNIHRECMPNHALHWAAIQWARERRCNRYDLWGIAEVGKTVEKTLLPEGLGQFKQGFGGRVVHYAPAHDVVLSRLEYKLYGRALALRRGGRG